jgi:hypothetical protein
VVSVLCSRVGKPDVQDAEKLARLFGYLQNTKDLVMRYAIGVEVDTRAYIDASFGIYWDGSSRTGVVLIIAGAIVAGWSSKQDIVTKSASESEIVGTSDGATPVLWCREFVKSQGYALKPTIIFQDNMGVIALMTNGRSCKNCTTHYLNIRYFFIRDRIGMNDVVLSYCPTKRMLADLMTKPVTGNLFIALRDEMMG